MYGKNYQRFQSLCAQNVHKKLLSIADFLVSLKDLSSDKCFFNSGRPNNKLFTLTLLSIFHIYYKYGFFIKEISDVFVSSFLWSLSLLKLIDVLELC